MIAVVDYGMGNVRSVVKAFARLGQAVNITCLPRDIHKASHVVLPGVGAFGDCVSELNRRNLSKVMLEVIDSGKPFLGICVGLQALLEGSDESPGIDGLKVIPGRVRRFEPSDSEMKVPHMGWNRISFTKDLPIAEGLVEDPFVYFVHSYYVGLDDTWTAAKAEYDVEFTAIAWRDNVIATQFHPEKSQHVGLRLLKNFSEWRPDAV